MTSPNRWPFRRAATEGTPNPKNPTAGTRYLSSMFKNFAKISSLSFVASVLLHAAVLGGAPEVARSSRGEMPRAPVTVHVVPHIPSARRTVDRVSEPGQKISREPTKLDAKNGAVGAAGSSAPPPITTSIAKSLRGLRDLVNRNRTEWDGFKTSCSSWYGGIGISSDEHIAANRDVTVSGVFTGYVAAEAGVEVGDTISSDGESIAGPPGTVLRINVYRRGSPVRTLRLVRERICLAPGGAVGEPSWTDAGAKAGG